LNTAVFVTDLAGRIVIWNRAATLRRGSRAPAFNPCSRARRSTESSTSTAS